MSEQLKIGSLCSGYLDGGLDLAVEEFFGAETAWFAEYDAAPSKVLAHHWPDVPNYGDMTTIDWQSVPKVDIVAGGTPCQDLSAAGRRKGMTEGTRSNLWVQMRECIAAVRPSVVVWENVRGAYSACADSDVGQCPGCVGESKQHRPFLRALGRVLGDLSDLGFDAEVIGLRAADAGAPHGRFRVFVVAYADSAGRGSLGRVDTIRCDADGRGRADGPRTAGEPAAPATDTRGARLGEHSGAASQEEAAGRSQVTEPASDRGSRPAVDWGPYRPAIERWEHVLGRVAPTPTNPDGKGGAHRLAPEFVEWMMGAPGGWVTSVEGVTRNEQLRMLGNGVVTQQALLALSIAWGRLADVRQAVAA